jgi:hypothetical protein
MCWGRGRDFVECAVDLLGDRLVLRHQIDEGDYSCHLSRAGTPATMESGGNVSGDHGAGSHEGPRPDSHATKDDDAGTERSASLHHGSQEGPIVIRLGNAFVGRGAREPVVDEENPVTDDDLIFDLHAVANERVARDLAGGAD